MAENTNYKEKTEINKKRLKKRIILISIIVVILTAVGVKQYNYAKPYFDAIDTIMSGDYSTAKDFLLVNYVGDDFLDSKSLQLFCLAMSDYEAENYFGAYYIIHNYYGGCSYLTSKQREFVNSNIKDINDAYEKYEKERETTTEVETTHYHTTTQTTTVQTTTAQTTTKKSSVSAQGSGSRISGNFTGYAGNNSSGKTTKHTTTKKEKSTTKKDPYDVNDYDDEEDFYYDHYDDFFDYYDAEDYYRDHHE